MPLPDHYAPSSFLDDHGFRRELLFAYDADGRPVASILFKGRNELPEYSLLRSGSAVHLGDAPSLYRSPEPGSDWVDPEVAHQEWLPATTDTGIPHYVVDVTPVGVAELAARLSGDAQWQRLADDMRAGIWGPRALALADALAATLSVRPDGLPMIAAALEQRQVELGLALDRAAAGIDAVFTGDVSQLDAFEAMDPDVTRRFRAQVADAEYDRPKLTDAARDYWRSRVRTLRGEGRLGDILAELQHPPEDMAVRSGLIQCVEQVLIVSRDKFPGQQRAMVTRAWFEQSNLIDAPLAVALALAGDQEAVRRVAQALDVMKAHDAFMAAERDRQRQRYALRPETSSVAPIPTKELVLVHATSFEPPRADDGSVRLATRFDTTGYGRSSLHFTLNHPVAPHMYGTWDAAGYVVVAPFDAAVERNGNPANLLGVDTWWTRDPGVPITLPEAVVVRVDPDQSELILRNGNEVSVKSKNFSDEEIRMLEADGVLNAAAIEESLVLQVDAGMMEASQVSDAREAMYTTSARNFAVHEVIRSLGGPITRGGDWACAMEDRIRPIAIERGLDWSAHDGSPTYAAERFGNLALVTPDVRRVAVAGGNVAPIAERVVVRSREQSASLLM